MYTDSPAYKLMLYVQSWMRWPVLFTGFAVVAMAIVRMRSRRQWDAPAERMALAFFVTSTIQFVLGFFLYFFLTPWVSALVSFPDQVLGARGMRFWAVEHTAAMILALVAVHFGRIRILDAVAEKKAQTALLWFGGALVLILIGMPWPFLRYGRPLFRW